MESENLNQYQDKERIEPKIMTSRDGKWIIIRVPGVEQPIIKAVAYFKAILANAEKRIDAEMSSTIKKLRESEKIKE